MGKQRRTRKNCLSPSLCKCIRLWSFASVLSKRTTAFGSTAIFIRHADKHKHENECTPRCINISLRIFYDTSHPNENLNMLFKGNKHISLQEKEERKKEMECGTQLLYENLKRKIEKERYFTLRVVHDE